MCYNKDMHRPRILDKLSPEDWEGIRRISGAAIGAIAITATLVIGIEAGKNEISNRIDEAFSSEETSENTNQPDSILDILDR